MPTPIRWTCPTVLTADEARVAQMLHRIGKFYVFLREIRASSLPELRVASGAASHGLDDSPYPAANAPTLVQRHD